MADNFSKLKIVPLGGGCEVGRSCIYVNYKSKHILLDCGIHPSEPEFCSLPFLDYVDPAIIDILLITQFYNKFPFGSYWSIAVFYGVYRV